MVSKNSSVIMDLQASIPNIITDTFLIKLSAMFLNLEFRAEHNFSRDMLIATNPTLSYYLNVEIGIKKAGAYIITATDKQSGKQLLCVDIPKPQIVAEINNLANRGKV